MKFVVSTVLTKIKQRARGRQINLKQRYGSIFASSNLKLLKKRNSVMGLTSSLFLVLMSCCRCRAYVYLPFNRPYSPTTGTTPPLKASNAEWQATAERIQILYEQKMRDYGWYTRSEGVQAVSLSIEDAYLQTLKRDLLLAADAFTLTQESRLDMNEEEKQRAGLLGSTSRSGGDGVDLDENARMAVELIEKLSTFSDIRQDDARCGRQGRPGRGVARGSSEEMLSHLREAVSGPYATTDAAPVRYVCCEV